MGGLICLQNAGCRTGGPDDNIGGTGLEPLVKQSSCATDLRRLCNSSSPAQTRAMGYGLSGKPEHRNPGLLEDLANFLLVRGRYAWLGWGWEGCSRQYYFPDEFNVDYGEPNELCKETAPGIFTR